MSPSPVNWAEDALALCRRTQVELQAKVDALQLELDQLREAVESDRVDAYRRGFLDGERDALMRRLVP